MHWLTILLSKEALPYRTLMADGLLQATMGIALIGILQCWGLCFCYMYNTPPNRTRQYYPLHESSIGNKQLSISKR